MTESPTCARCSRPLADGATICREDAQTLAEALTAAAGHAEDAWTVIARQARYGTASGARTVEPEPAGVDVDERRNRVKEFGWAASLDRPIAGALRPGIIPPDLSASARLAAATNTVTTWARHVCEELGVELPARRTASDLGEAAAWLATQVDWLRMRPEADEAFDELHDACQLLARLVDRPGDRNDRLVGMCDCGKILYAPHGRDVTQCRACGAAWNVSESQAILLRHLDGQLVTVPEALDMAGWLDVDRTREQIRKLLTKWIDRSLVLSHGHAVDQDGTVRPTYRFGEIRARLAETPRRTREGANA